MVVICCLMVFVIDLSGYYATHNEFPVIDHWHFWPRVLTLFTAAIFVDLFDFFLGYNFHGGL